MPILNDDNEKAHVNGFDLAKNLVAFAQVPSDKVGGLSSVIQDFFCFAQGTVNRHPCLNLRDHGPYFGNGRFDDACFAQVRCKGKGCHGFFLEQSRVL